MATGIVVVVVVIIAMFPRIVVIGGRGVFKVVYLSFC